MIEIKNLNYRIRGSVILKDINLQIPKGELASVIGPNGAGKSTLLKIILGLIQDYSGEVFIEGIPHRKWLRKNLIGYLTQRENFDRDFPATVLEMTLMGRAGQKGLFRPFSAREKEEALRVLGRVGLREKSRRFIGTLSGGELQRLYLGRALFSRTEYLFLDEPEAHVDETGLSAFYRLIQELHKEGRTVLIVSHDISGILKFSTRLVCLNKTLHYHNRPELLSSEILDRTYGKVMQIIEHSASPDRQKDPNGA